jgi:hypothetical protein
MAALPTIEADSNQASAGGRIAGFEASLVIAVRIDVRNSRVKSMWGV